MEMVTLSFCWLQNLTPLAELPLLHLTVKYYGKKHWIMLLVHVAYRVFAIAMETGFPILLSIISTVESLAMTEKPER